MPVNLETVNLKTLTMREAIDALFDEKILLIRGVEQRRNGDVLVRLDTKGRVPVLQSSFDLVPPDGVWRERYWVVTDLSINVFSTYPCFVYDEALANKFPNFIIGDTVHYVSKEDNIRDSAIVIEVFKDEDNQWHYMLSRDGEIYEEYALSKDRLK